MNPHRRAKIAFWSLAAVLLIAFVRLSLDAGNSGDEDPFQIPQGRNIVNYFKTAGEDSSCMTFQNLKYYGSSFDVAATWVADVLDIEDISKLRHLMNAFCGWLTLVFVGLIVWKIGGLQAALIALLLLFFSPRFLGHSFNNPKDIPFALSVIAALYFMLRFFEDFPKIKKRIVIGLIASIAFSISVRIGGLILFGYFGLFGLVFLVQNYFDRKLLITNTLNSGKKLLNERKKAKPKWVDEKLFRKLLFWGVGIGVLGYFGGLIIWPYALEAPLSHPWEAFKEMSAFAVSLRQNFEGQLMWSDALPWYYTPKFILITIPLGVVVGSLFYLFAGAWSREKRLGSILLYFTALFPIFWLTYTHANVYGGWRHSLFMYPSLVALGALGLSALFDRLGTFLAHRFGSSRPSLWIGGLCVIGMGCIVAGPLRHYLRNHPYEYVYFNSLGGGMEKSYGHYEMDYYYHSIREATEWILKHGQRTGLEKDEKIIVAGWHLSSVQYFLRKDTLTFGTAFARFHERGNSDWDYAVFAVTGMSPDLIKSPKAFPPANTVYTVSVDNKPICLVLKRTDKSDYHGYRCRQEGKIDSAIFLLKQSLRLIPTQESTLLNLAEIYLDRQQNDSALYYLDQLLTFDASNETASYYKGYLLMMSQRLPEAQAIFTKLCQQNPKNSNALWLLANVYAGQGMVMPMEKTLEELLFTNFQQKDDILNLLQRTYSQMGMSNDDATRTFYRMAARVLDKMGYPEEAENARQAIRF